MDAHAKNTKKPVVRGLDGIALNQQELATR